MKRRQSRREYTAHTKTRCCPGGLRCCGCLYGTGSAAKRLSHRHVRRVTKMARLELDYE